MRAREKKMVLGERERGEKRFEFSVAETRQEAKKVPNGREMWR